MVEGPNNTEAPLRMPSERPQKFMGKGGPGKELPQTQDVVGVSRSLGP